MSKSNAGATFIRTVQSYVRSLITFPIRFIQEVRNESKEYEEKINQQVALRKIFVTTKDLEKNPSNAEAKKQQKDALVDVMESFVVQKNFVDRLSHSKKVDDKAIIR